MKIIERMRAWDQRHNKKILIGILVFSIVSAFFGLFIFQWTVLGFMMAVYGCIFTYMSATILYQKRRQ